MTTIVRTNALKECSQREVAAFLGLPVTTVNSRLHEARTLLKKGRLEMVAERLGGSALPGDHAERIGRIITVKGPVVVARLEPEDQPELFDSIAVAGADGVLEERLRVVQPGNDGVVPCLAAGSGEGLEPGLGVVNPTRGRKASRPPSITDEDLELAARSLLPGARTRGPILETGIKSIRATDPDYAREAAPFDVSLYCSPVLAVQGLFQAIDCASSRSVAEVPAVVGAEHHRIAEGARTLLREGRRLAHDPVFLEYLACRAWPRARSRAEEHHPERMRSLRVEERLHLSRARKLERFLTTSFHVAKPHSGRDGREVPRAEILRGARAVLDGDCDGIPEDSLWFIGALDEAEGT